MPEMQGKGSSFSSSECVLISLKTICNILVSPNLAAVNQSTEFFVCGVFFVCVFFTSKRPFHWHLP